MLSPSAHTLRLHRGHTAPPELTSLKDFTAKSLLADERDIYEMPKHKNNGAWIQIKISPRRNVWSSNQQLEKEEKYGGLQ